MTFSPHFDLHQLAPGVFAAFAAADGYAVGNAGIIDLGDRTLVFDTCITPEAARDLKRAANALTGKRVAVVVNSHYHNDHIRGNQIFDDADLISTALTREMMDTKGRGELAQDIATSRERLAGNLREMETAARPRRIQDLKILAAIHRGIVESLNEVALVLSRTTFDSEMILHGTGRTARLLTFGGGHTESDALLYLPGEKILFIGDLIFVNHHPYLADGDPWNLKKILQRVRALDVQRFVAGHGPCGTWDDVRANEQYIDDVIYAAQNVIARGGRADDAQAIALPEAYAEWQFDFFWGINTRFCFEQLEIQKQKTGE